MEDSKQTPVESRKGLVNRYTAGCRLTPDPHAQDSFKTATASYRQNRPCFDSPECSIAVSGSMEGRRECKLPITVMAMMVLIGAAQAQSPPASCVNSLAGLAPCVSYVTGSSSENCCAGLATVVGGGVACVCQIMNNVNTFGFSVNRTFVLALSKSCKINTPPLDQCEDVPASGPGVSPGSSPAESPANAPSPALSATEDVAPRAFSPHISPSGSLGPARSLPSNLIRPPSSHAGSSGVAADFTPTFIKFLLGIILTSIIW